MKYLHTYSGIDLFESTHNQESSIVLRLDTPDGLLPVGRKYLSVEDAQKDIDNGLKTFQTLTCPLIKKVAEPIAG